MKATNKISKSIVDYEFWLWEYQRRDSTYQENLAKITNEAFTVQKKHTNQTNSTSSYSCLFSAKSITFKYMCQL